jgi:hypothetical protein
MKPRIYKYGGAWRVETHYDHAICCYTLPRALAFARRLHIVREAVLQ